MPVESGDQSVDPHHCAPSRRQLECQRQSFESAGEALQGVDRSLRGIDRNSAESHAVLQEFDSGARPEVFTIGAPHGQRGYTNDLLAPDPQRFP